MGIMPQAQATNQLQERGSKMPMSPAVVNMPQQESAAPVVTMPQAPAVMVPPAVVNMPQQESAAPVVMVPQAPAVMVPPAMVNAPQQENRERDFDFSTMDIPKGLWDKAVELLGLNGGGDTTTISNIRNEQKSTNSSFTAPAITINLTVNGNTEPEGIKKAVLDAGQQMQRSFEEQMAEFTRRKERLAY
jgi:hypothetical protein